MIFWAFCPSGVPELPASYSITVFAHGAAGICYYRHTVAERNRVPGSPEHADVVW